MTKQELRDKLTTLFSGREHFDGEVYITEAMVLFEEYQKHRDKERMQKMRQAEEILSRKRKDAYLAGDIGLEHTFDNQVRGLYKAIAIMTEEDKP